MADTKIPLADLHRQHAPLRAELDAAVASVLDRCDFVRGAALGRFEQAFAEFLGAHHVVGVGSGTDALALALAALEVGPGHEVITAANSFAATAEAIVMVGAQPVFCDVDPETLNMDPGSLGQVVTERTRAVIPVHLHGLPAEMDAICALAAERGLRVVEDAAQAHGSVYRGRQAGTLGDAGCFSFFPSKNLGCCGDGGAVSTADEEVAKRLSMLRDHGRQRSSRRHAVVGQCSRLDTLQAAILEVKLPQLARWNERRRALAERYHHSLEGLSELGRPPLRPGAVFHHYVVKVPRRQQLRELLSGLGIATGVHYERSIPEEPAYARYRTIPTPVADASCQRTLSLPLFPEMTDEEVDRVVEAVRSFFAG